MFLVPGELNSVCHAASKPKTPASNNASNTPKSAPEKPKPTTKPEGTSTPSVQKQQDEALEYNNFALWLGSKKRWSDAIANHVHALMAQPRVVEYRENLSACYLETGKYLASKNSLKEAMNMFRKALYIDIENRPAAELLKQLQDATAQSDPALQAASLKEAASKYESKAVELEQQNRLADALDNYDRALLNAPDNGDYRQSLSACHEKMAVQLQAAGNLDDAEFHFRRALFVSPENPTALTKLKALVHSP